MCLLPLPDAAFWRNGRFFTNNGSAKFLNSLKSCQNENLPIREFMQFYLELLGYLASALVAISLMMSSVLKLRVINLAGGCGFFDLRLAD
jgi:hypothetical protein